MGGMRGVYVLQVGDYADQHAVTKRYNRSSCRASVAHRPGAAMTDLELRAQIDELFLLQRVAQRISALLDIEVLLEEVVGDVSQTFGYSRSAVLLKDESTNELVIAAVRGWTVNYHQKGERFKIGEYGIVGHVGATAETYYAPDVLIDPYYKVSEPLTRSELDIPLKWHGRFIGILNVQSTSVDGFPPSR